MKKIYLSFGILLSALTFASCDQAEMLTGASQKSATTSLTMSASSLQTRTAIDGLNVSWAEGDKVGMFCGGISSNTTNVLFDVIPGENGSNATLKSAGDMHWAFNEDTYVYGYYPYAAGVQGTEAEFKLPQVQTQTDAKASQLSKYDYLVAAPVSSSTGEGINVTFQHVMSWIDFVVTNTDNKDITVNSVDLVCDNSLVSTAKIDLSANSENGNFMAFTSPATTSKLSVEASATEENAWNVLKAGESLTLRMAIFPCDLTGKDYQMIAHTSAGDFPVKKTGKNIERAKRYNGKIALFFPALAVSELGNFASTGGEQEVTITTNMDWSIDATTIPDYVQITPMSGSGNSTIKVTVASMSSEDSNYATGRGAKIVVKAHKGTDYDGTANIEVRQNGNNGVDDVEFKGDIDNMNPGDDL